MDSYVLKSRADLCTPWRCMREESSEEAGRQRLSKTYAGEIHFLEGSLAGGFGRGMKERDNVSPTPEQPPARHNEENFSALCYFEQWENKTPRTFVSWSLRAISCGQRSSPNILVKMLGAVPAQQTDTASHKTIILSLSHTAGVNWCTLGEYFTDLTLFVRRCYIKAYISTPYSSTGSPLCSRL